MRWKVRRSWHRRGDPGQAALPGHTRSPPSDPLDCDAHSAGLRVLRVSLKVESVGPLARRDDHLPPGALCRPAVQSTCGGFGVLSAQQELLVSETKVWLWQRSRGAACGARGRGHVHQDWGALGWARRRRGLRVTDHVGLGILGVSPTKEGL